jgi:hypothetical protein
VNLQNARCNDKNKNKHSSSVSSINYWIQSRNPVIVEDYDQYVYVTCVHVSNKRNLNDLLGKLLLSNLNGKGEGQQMRFFRPLLDLTRLDKQRNTSICTRHSPILTEMEETFGKDGQRSAFQDQPSRRRDLGRPQQRRKFQEHVQVREEQVLMDSTLTVFYDNDDDVKAHISLQACHHVMKSCVGRQKILL